MKVNKNSLANCSRDKMTEFVSANTTHVESQSQVSLLEKILVGIACVIVIFLTLIGNTLVVSVIIRFKRLKNATNYILLSLAIADITVTFLVMIPAMIQDVIQKWIFNDLFCKFYNAFDITCCTASILHLLLVAMDRYVAIFKPLAYKNLVRTWHVFVGVISVWTLSLCMSFIPIFLGLNLKDSSEPGPKDTCMLEANMVYAVISSSLSFFIPLIIMTCVYFRIFIVAKHQAKAIAQIDQRTRNLNPEMKGSNLLNSNESNNCLNNNELLNDKTINKLLSESEETRSLDDKKNRFLKLLKQIKIIEKKRSKDTKAIKTLGIIMGIFILCWLPFFIMYVVLAVTNKTLPLIAERLITWIGYINSFINPIIYALTNKDFRKSYISTIKTIGVKMCPSLIRKLFFRREDDRKPKNKFNETKCKKIKPKSKNNSFSSTYRNSLNVPNSNNQNLLNHKKGSDDLNNFNLSDISENENSQLFNEINNSILCKMNEKSEPTENEKSNKESSVNNCDKSNGKQSGVCEIMGKSEETLSFNKRQNKKSKDTSFIEIFRRFSSRNPSNFKQKHNRSRSNDIILIRI